MSGGMVTEVKENINNMNYFSKKGSSTYIVSFATKDLTLILRYQIKNFIKIYLMPRKMKGVLYQRLFTIKLWEKLKKINIKI